MLLPIRTNIAIRKTPYANYALIGVNILIFLITYHPHFRYSPQFGKIHEPLRVWAEQFILTPNRPFIWQFVTYAFLHGSFMHIFGNMFFLYLFGNPVNSKLGHIAYISFYLAGAVFSAVGHSLFNQSPVLGASGAVAAITGAYLVLFPRSIITVIYWFFFIGTFELPAFFFIGFKLIVIDNVVSRTIPNVAYDAHLAGYFFGIGSLLIIFALGILQSDYTDLYFTFKQFRRRRIYRDAVSDGYDPFTGRRPRKRIRVKTLKQTPEEKRKQQQILDLRNEILSLLASKNLGSAAEKYLQLIQLDPDHVLPRQHLLDIANQLTSAGKWQQSADAYEKYLKHYKNSEYAEQVELMLGILYSKYLNNPQKAIDYFRSAKDKIIDPDQKKLCQKELDKLTSHN